MLDLFDALGFSVFGKCLSDNLDIMDSGIIGNRADAAVVKLVKDILPAKLADGRLPANHDLQTAIRESLRQALTALNLALAAGHHPASPALAQLRRQLCDPKDRKLPATAFLDVPLWTALHETERGWIKALAQTIDNPAALARVADGAAGDADGLLGEDSAEAAAQRLHRAVADWIAREMQGRPGRPGLLDEYLQDGWPLDENGRRITLHQAWRLFFREAIKRQPAVFNIYVAQTLLDIKRQLPAQSPRSRRVQAKQTEEASLDQFTEALTADFAELREWLDAGFRALDGHLDRQDKTLTAIARTQVHHRDLLKQIRSLIAGPALAGLWRSSRRFRYGLSLFAVVLLALLAGIGIKLVGLPQETATATAIAIDPAMIGARLRSEIQARFERDAEAARAAGKHWEALRELEKNRDAALNRVDDVLATIREGLAGNPGPVFKEASRILEKEGSDAALAYLASHQADLLARADRSAALAEAAQDKLKQDLQPLLLQANLHEAKQEWQAALALLQTVAAKAPQWGEARRRLGNSLYMQARYAEAEPQLRAALALATDEKDQATADNDLAALLQATNRQAEAEPLMRRALAIGEKSLGPEHPNVAIRLNNLATLLQDTNRLAEAEPLLRRALAIGEKSLGPEHLYVAAALSNLAQLLKATNRQAEAEPLLRQALAIQEKSYGPEHPAFATALNSLATLLQATNRQAEGEPLMRQALAIQEKSYGPEHPDVAISLDNLAVLLQATNRLAEAEPLMRRAVEIFEKSYGPEHPEVATALNNLATLLQDTNRLAEAEPLMRRKRVAIFRDTRNGVPSDFGSEKWATTLPSAARARPASATASRLRCASPLAMAATLTLRRFGSLMFCLRLRWSRRLRQNIRASGYAGVVALPVLLRRW